MSSATQSRFQFMVNGVNVASGDTIDMIVNLSDIQGTTSAGGTDAASASISSITVRDYSSDTRYVNGVSFSSVSTPLGDGWYKVSVPATCASTQLLYTFYFTNSNGGVFPVDGSMYIPFPMVLLHIDMILHPALMEYLVAVVILLQQLLILH